ncbi:transmembrane protein [Legionella lansingensis]|uniref:Transmembrane protein n=1 Tax=Legionella lansingensis TaxID=45067 RepID=A0A0W0VIZ7_9GAMM|nr:hypothetical protein [Legionella lansingensis]KTD20097.1 transmembrane protein [Legionella lansingensis]SNV51114.1 transmembrane protein [Legionella lansingensis]
MEYDRFQQNSVLFVIGIIALLLSLSLFTICFYIFPFLLFDWVYNVPEFVSIWREWLIEEYNYTITGASWVILLIFLVPAFICGYISYFISNYIDNRLYGIVPEETAKKKRVEIRKDIQETLVFVLKILGLVILVLIGISILQWIVAVPTPS